MFRVDGIKAPPIVLPDLIADLENHQRPEFVGSEAKPREAFSESVSLMMRHADHVGPSLSIHPPIRRTALDVCQTRSTVREEGGGFSQVGASRPEVEEGVPA